MPKMIGGTHYLVLQWDPTDNSHHVRVLPRFDQVIPAWRFGTRVSPVFPMDSAKAEFSDTSSTWLVFLGPIHPGELLGAPFKQTFLNLGLLNILILCDTNQVREEALQFANSRQLVWEEWQLLGNRLVDVELSLKTRQMSPMPTAVTSPCSIPHRDLLPSIREYRANMATCLSRAQLFTPEFVSDLLRFDEHLRGIVQSTGLENTEKLKFVVTTNAAISRLSSQTYCGVSPMLSSECNLAPHSLLGVGIASLALIHIRRFIEDIFVRAGMTDRLLGLTTVRPRPFPLHMLPHTDEIWNKDVLFPNPGDVLEPSASKKTGEYLPMLTFFSGRDGFRSTNIGVSAPLEAISSCNCTPWSLQTITHEISHTIVDGVLGALIPPVDDSAGVDAAFDLLDPERSQTDLVQQLKAFLYFSIWLMKAEDSTSQEIDRAGFEDLIVDMSDVREILTHVFDFLYFYGKDEDRYVHSAWVSWSVVPNIEDRIPDYVTRCLCALHAENLRRSDGPNITADRLLNCLNNARADYPSNPIVAKAIDEVSNNRSWQLTRLNKCAPLVKFVRYFLYSQVIGQALEHDPLAGAGGGSAGLAVTEFSELRVGNPLGFIKKFSADAEGEGLRSAWLLTQLAF